MKLFHFIFLILSILFYIASISNFIACLVLKYFAAAVWSMFTGLLTGIAIHLNFLVYKDRLSRWYGLEELEFLNRLSFAFIAITITGFVYHSAYYGLTVYHNYPHDFAIVYALIQSAVSSFWSLVLKLLVEKLYGQTISTN